MNTYCKFYLENNIVKDNKLNTYYYYGISNHQRIVHVDNSVIKSELKKSLIRDLYGLFRDKLFHCREDCYCFNALFDSSVKDMFTPIGHEFFFDENKDRFNCEV